MMECSCSGQVRDLVLPLQCMTRSRCAECASDGFAPRLASSTRHRSCRFFDMSASIEFYEAAGFDVRRYEGGDYAFVTYEEESVFDLDVAEPALDFSANKSGCYLITADTDEWHTRLLQRLPSRHQPRRQTLGHARVHPHRPQRQPRENRSVQ